jgi:hypothetical protein
MLSKENEVGYTCRTKTGHRPEALWPFFWHL